MAKVDIVVPCYNYARFLQACVRSVLDQSVRDLRVLVIDDASSDESLSIAAKLADADGRVGIIAHPKNWGHIETYNQGISLASADYFLLLSADDMLAPGALERAVEVMDANPDIVLTHGRCVSWVDGGPPPKVVVERRYTCSRHDLIADMCSYGGNLVRTPTAIVRTSAQKAAGGYRASLPHSADMEMWLRLAAHGAVARIDAVQAIYRQHSSNMSIAYYDREFGDLQQRKQAFDSFFDEYGSRVLGAPRLRGQATRALAGKVFLSGIVQLCRGRIGSSRLLLRFAFNLDPDLCFRPPLRHAPTFLWQAATRFFNRGRFGLLSLLKARHMDLWRRDG